MTKIFALNPKENDEKPKQLEGIAISPTTPTTTFYPVNLPISSIVAKKRYGISHIIVILLSLMIVSMLFYTVPYFFYKRAHHLFSSEINVHGPTSQWAQQPNRYDTVNGDAHVAPKFDSSDKDASEGMNRMDQNGYMIQDNRGNYYAGNQEREIAANNDAEVKQPDDMVPNRSEAMKAIATLLKIPGVQQVAVIQNNARMPDNTMIRPETDEKPNNLDEITPSIMSQAKSLTQSQVPLTSQMETKEWEMMNFRRAMREWLLRREIFRRRMIAEMERERQEAAERRMAQFIMALQLQQQQQQQQQQEIQQPESVLPVFPFTRMQVSAPVIWTNNIQSAPMEMLPVISPPMIVPPRIPPMHPFMFPRQQQQQQQPQQQQQQPLQQPLQQAQQQQQQSLQQEQEQPQQPSIIVPIKLMPPQMMNREEPIIQHIDSDSIKPDTAPMQIQDDSVNRLDLEQKKIPVVDQSVPMTLDGTPDRDTIFKELRSRAQMQQQMSQTTLPLISPLLPSIVSPAQINSDEIFRELQHRALRIQMEQDRLDAEQRAEKEKNADSDIPVLMIADAFPRRTVEEMPEQTPEEITESTVSANIETTTMDSIRDNSSESPSTFFNFLDKESHENEITSSPEKEQEIAIKNDDVKQSDEDNTFNDVIAIANDAEAILKIDDIPPQPSFIQESATTGTSSSLESSEETNSELFKSAIRQDKPIDMPNNDMLNTPIKLLETPVIQ